MRDPGGRSRPSHDPVTAWTVVVAVIAAACLVVSVSFQIFDVDLWPQLARARALLTTHTLPHQQMWTWPDYGAPERNATWGHALLLWPFWTVGGVSGLFVWRWLTVLATFGLAWATARTLGARGFSVFVVLVGCAMVYRTRSQMRPETVALILLALELWILESRRRGGPDRLSWLAGVAWLWPSVHISYLLGLLVCGVSTLDELLSRRRRPTRGAQRKVRLAPPANRSGRAERKPGPGTAERAAAQVERRPAPLLLPLLLMTGASFLNPLGWSVLAFPFQYLFTLREQGFDLMVAELWPVNWDFNWRNGLPLLMLAWPALQAWRVSRRRFDRVEAVLWAAFTYEALTHQRFLSFWAVVAAPYLARDLDEFVLSRRWPVALAHPWARAGASATACVAMTALECSRAELPLGLSFRPGAYPIAACDFIEREGVRGRGFNYFEEGGYLLWRFWPDRERLPFMTNAPELSSPTVRMSYRKGTAFQQEWKAMDARYRFDYVLLKRRHDFDDHYLDFLDADSSFALVFADDASALYLRREGRMAPIAQRFGYRWLSGGQARRVALGPALMQDSAARNQMRSELERAIRSSPRHAQAAFVLGAVEMMDAHWGAAERQLDEAYRLDSELAGYHLRKGVIALATHRPLEAIRLLEIQRRIAESDEVDLRLASALWAADRRAEAVATLERALRRYPGNQVLLDTLTTLRGRMPR